MTTTSWQPVHKWYDKSVGESGNYYHQHVIITGTLKLLDLKPTSSLLDLACGQGVLERAIPTSVNYLGLDNSLDLVKSAKHQSKSSSHKFLLQDITQPYSGKFTHAAIILALQNIEFPDRVITNLSSHLNHQGTFVMENRSRQEIPLFMAIQAFKK